MTPITMTGEGDIYPDWSGISAHTVRSVDDVNLHVNVTGDPEGIPILLIHGALQSRLVWEKQMIEGISDKFRVAAMDLRGHGRSGKPDSSDAYCPDLWAQDIEMVLSELNLSQPILVGWSVGGWMVCDYIQQVGTSEISGINFVSTSAGAPVDGVKNPEDNIRGDPNSFEEHVSSIGEFVHSMFAKDISPRDFYYFLGINLQAKPGSMARSVDYNSLLPTIDVPTLITCGTGDSIISQPVIENLHNSLPASNVSWYPDVGHVPFWVQPQRFTNELENFATAPEESISGT